MERPSAPDLRRRIPSLDRILRRPEISRLIELYGREPVRVQVRHELEELRRELADGDDAGEGLRRRLERLPGSVAAAIEERLRGSLQRVLNATGILIHTNLGRSPLPRSVAASLPGLLDAACDLELDLASGRRSERNRRVEALLGILTGCEAALAANNNAAALSLVLAAHARGREVVVSRGELVEIGGSFRIPDILRAAGARLVEVGTTNRTRLEDYARAIGEETALLLKVHPSNYRISGFVESVEPAGLAELAHRHGLLAVVDEGSGLLRPHPAPQLADHPSFQELVAAGCDLVCGSGDKLLGGPQAGLLVGRREAVERCRRHPLYRTVRPDRAAYAALEGVLRMRLAGGETPLDRLWPDPGEHRGRLEAVAGTVGAEIVPGEAFLGGGSAPERPIPGEVLALAGGETLLRRLRLGRPPVMGYVREDRVLLDLRTVDPEDDGSLVAAVAAASGGSG